MDLLGELVGYSSNQPSLEPESGVESPRKGDETEDGPETEGLALLTIFEQTLRFYSCSEKT